MARKPPKKGSLPGTVCDMQSAAAKGIAGDRFDQTSRGETKAKDSKQAGKWHVKDACTHK